MPGENFDCPVGGCGRTGEYGFVRKDHFREHLREVHAKDVPKINRRSERGLERQGDVGSYNADSKAPSELKAQAENNNEVPKPVGLPKSPPVKLPKTTMLLGNPSNRERLGSLSSQTPYVAEKGLSTASSTKTFIGHGMDEDDKESPSSTKVESVRDVQVAPEPKITDGESISQSVKLGYGHNALNPNQQEPLLSTVSADVERSTMTMTGERGVQDTVEPEKIILEPDNEAQASILDHSVHTMPLTFIAADDGLMSDLSDDGCVSDDGYEHFQDGDDVSLADGPLCFHLVCVCRPSD